MNYENLENLSLTDLIALKSYLITDRVPHWENLDDGENDSDYQEMIQICKEMAGVIDSILADRLIEINPEYNL